MNKIVADILLLPPDEIMDAAIELNAEWRKSNPDDFVLNKTNCFPHISLVVGALDMADMPKIGQIIDECAKKYLPLHLESTSIYAMNSSGFAIEPNEQLQKLHEELTQRSESLITSEVTVEMFASTYPISEGILGWARAYREKMSNEKFFPHITIGHGGVARALDTPLVFTVTKLAVGHSSGFGTCSEILAEAM